MKTLIKALAAIAACFYFVSCANSQMPFVKRTDLEASELQNKALKGSLDSLQANYAAQTQELSEILAELSSISLKTSSLQLKVEAGAAPMTQTDSIYNNIGAIKSRIDALEKQAAKVRKLNKSLALANSTIEKLRVTVENQEREILSLKKTIAEKDNTIEGQQQTISNQSSTIARQEIEIFETVTKQTDMIFKAGSEFEAIADEGAFKITGKKNKMSVNDYRISLYEKALDYYKMASEMKHPGAVSKIAVIEQKIKALQNL